MKKGILLTVVALMLLVGPFFGQHSAQAWPWTKTVNIYGFATVGTYAKFVLRVDEVRIYKNGTEISRPSVNFLGRWYVNDVAVNETYTVKVRWGKEWKQASMKVEKPGKIAYDVGLPSITF